MDYNSWQAQGVVQSVYKVPVSNEEMCEIISDDISPVHRYNHLTCLSSVSALNL